MASQPFLSWTMTVSKLVHFEHYRCFIVITGATVSLEQTQYRFDERDGVNEIEVCAHISSPSISCPIKFPFEVGLATDHQSAGECTHNIIAW